MESRKESPLLVPGTIIHMPPQMSLRDWFAGQALIGLLSNPARASIHMGDRAYEEADSMLSARAAQGKP
jgi:hypothetical protein